MTKTNLIDIANVSDDVLDFILNAKNDDVHVGLPDEVAVPDRVALTTLLVDVFGNDFARVDAWLPKTFVPGCSTSKVAARYEDLILARQERVL